MLFLTVYSSLILTYRKKQPQEIKDPSAIYEANHINHLSTSN